VFPMLRPVPALRICYHSRSLALGRDKNDLGFMGPGWKLVSSVLQPHKFLGSVFSNGHRCKGDTAAHMSFVHCLTCVALHRDKAGVLALGVSRAFIFFLHGCRNPSCLTFTA
jgi:hypothetical protein